MTIFLGNQIKSCQVCGSDMTSNPSSDTVLPDRLPDEWTRVTCPCDQHNQAALAKARYIRNELIEATVYIEGT